MPSPSRPASSSRWRREKGGLWVCVADLEALPGSGSADPVVAEAEVRHLAARPAPSQRVRAEACAAVGVRAVRRHGFACNGRQGSRGRPANLHHARVGGGAGAGASCLRRTSSATSRRRLRRVAPASRTGLSGETWAGVRVPPAPCRIRDARGWILILRAGVCRRLCSTPPTRTRHRSRQARLGRRVPDAIRRIRLARRLSLVERTGVTCHERARALISGNGRTPAACEESCRQRTGETLHRYQRQWIIRPQRACCVPDRSRSFLSPGRSQMPSA